jgi:hypothetical protein
MRSRTSLSKVSSLDELYIHRIDWFEHKRNTVFRPYTLASCQPILKGHQGCQTNLAFPLLKKHWWISSTLNQWHIKQEISTHLARKALHCPY